MAPVYGRIPIVSPRKVHDIKRQTVAWDSFHNFTGDVSRIATPRMPPPQHGEVAKKAESCA
jgi:hypothetical protein